MSPQVRVLPGLEGLEAVRGAVVVLDIYRASNTIIALLAAGASGVWLLSETGQALDLKARHPERLLLGERKGVTIPGFEGGNSPVHAPELGPAGKEVILTTSAGTQAVHRLGQAGPVCFGSFANARALASALARLAPPEINLLPMGLEAREPALEDQLAAQYLAELFAGGQPDFAALRPALLDCPGAQRLRSLGQDDDLVFCTTLDSQTVVPLVAFEDLPVARALAPPRP